MHRQNMRQKKLDIAYMKSDHAVCATLIDGTCVNAIREYDEKTEEYVFVNESGDITQQVASWESGFCQEEIHCKKASTLYTVIDNTGTRFSWTAEILLTFTDDSTTVITQTPTGGWTDQLNQWVTIFGDAQKEKCAQSLAEARCNIEPNGCGGLLPPPTELLGRIPDMRWRYLQLLACPNCPAIKRAQVISINGVDQANPIDLVLNFLAGREVRYHQCISCKDPSQSTLYYQEGYEPDGATSLLVAEADMPICLFDCAEEIPPTPESACNFELVEICDTDRPNDETYIQFADCGDGQIVNAFYFVDPDGGLEEYTPNEGSIGPCGNEVSSTVLCDECDRQIEIVTFDDGVIFYYEWSDEDGRGEQTMPSGDLGKCEPDMPTPIGCKKVCGSIDKGATGPSTVAYNYDYNGSDQPFAVGGSTVTFTINGNSTSIIYNSSNIAQFNADFSAWLESTCGGSWTATFTQATGIPGLPLQDLTLDGDGVPKQFTEIQMDSNSPVNSSVVPVVPVEVITPGDPIKTLCKAYRYDFVLEDGSIDTKYKLLGQEDFATDYTEYCCEDCIDIACPVSTGRGSLIQNITFNDGTVWSAGAEFPDPTGIASINDILGTSGHVTTLMNDPRNIICTGTGADIGEVAITNAPNGGIASVEIGPDPATTTVYTFQTIGDCSKGRELGKTISKMEVCLVNGNQLLRGFAVLCTTSYSTELIRYEDAIGQEVSDDWNVITCPCCDDGTYQIIDVIGN